MPRHVVLFAARGCNARQSPILVTTAPQTSLHAADLADDRNLLSRASAGCSLRFVPGDIYECLLWGVARPGSLFVLIHRLAVSVLFRTAGLAYKFFRLKKRRCLELCKMLF